MIDTIKLSFPSNKDLFRSNNKSFRIRNSVVEPVWSNFYIPSYSRDVNLFTPPDGKGFINFSVPKLLYKSNIIEVTSKDVFKAVQEVYATLQKTFLDFPSFSQLALQRLDVCHNFDVGNQANVTSYIKAITDQYSRRKKPLNLYDQTVYFKGHVNLKFYNKYIEFHARKPNSRSDYSLLKEGSNEGKFSDDGLNINIADDLSDKALKMLRFEIALGRPDLEEIFGNLTWCNINLNDQLIKDIINRYLRLFDFDKLPMAKHKIIDILTEKYGTSMAATLFGFYSMRNNQKYIKQVPPDTKYKYRKLLREANIGITSRYKLPPLEIL